MHQRLYLHKSQEKKKTKRRFKCDIFRNANERMIQDVLNFNSILLKMKEDIYESDMSITEMSE